MAVEEAAVDCGGAGDRGHARIWASATLRASSAARTPASGSSSVRLVARSKPSTGTWTICAPWTSRATRSIAVCSSHAARCCGVTSNPLTSRPPACSTRPRPATGRPSARSPRTPRDGVPGAPRGQQYRTDGRDLGSTPATAASSSALTRRAARPRASRRRSAGVRPPAIPSGIRISASSRHSARTEQPAHTAFAAATCRSYAGPASATGKNASGFVPRQAASDRQSRRGVVLVLLIVASVEKLSGPVGPVAGGGRLPRRRFERLARPRRLTVKGGRRPSAQPMRSTLDGEGGRAQPGPTGPPRRRRVHPAFLGPRGLEREPTCTSPAAAEPARVLRNVGARVTLDRWG